MKRLLKIACLALVSFACIAHQDALLKVQADGRIDGLPPEYNPASLRIAFSQNDEPGWPPISGLALNLGGRSVVVPQCVTRLVLTRSMKDIQVVASWYHNTSVSPPYIEVALFDPGHEDLPTRPGYRLAFNLSTAKLFRMDVAFLRGKSDIYNAPVDVSQLCPDSDVLKFSERVLRPNTSLERTRER
jgi:hypothetical protein